jgi:O-antigen/teichoic acid export membrane protein
MKFVRHVYVYFFSYFANAGLSFVTISFLTHKLAPRDYGIINLYSSFITLLMPFISGGILYPLSIEYYKRPEEDYRKFFTNAHVITLISLLLITAACLVFQHPLSVFLRVSPLWVTILPLAVWWVMSNEVAMMMYRIRNKPWGFASFSIGKNIVEIGLVFILVVGLQWTWEGRLLPAVATPLLFGIISISLFYRWRFIAKKIEWSEVRRIAWVSVPFIFERLTVFILANSDKYFIDKYDLKGTDQVGLYSVGAQIATIVSLVLLSMNSAYQPYIFQNLANKGIAKAKKATFMYIGGAGLLVGALFLTIPLIFQFFIGKQFAGARIFAYYLCGGYFMWGIYNAFLAYLLYHGKNRLILYLSLAAMVVSVTLNFWLVPRHGAYGAAITSIVTYTFLAILAIIYSRRYLEQKL